MANTRKSYTVFDIRPNYYTAQGDYGTLPFTPLGTAAGIAARRSKSPFTNTLAAYVPFDGVGLSFAADATAASQYIFRNYLGNTGGTATPNSGELLNGYGLIDISQSNEYVHLVGSLSVGTGTGSSYSSALTYANSILNRLNGDFPNVRWSIRGVPFNHYFLISSGSTGTTNGAFSPFGTGAYFHPQHPTGDVARVYDWTNVPSNIADFYKNRSKAVLGGLTGMKWICPSGLLFYDNTLPHLRTVFDPETAYRSNLECFKSAVEFVESSNRQLPVLPITSPIYSIRKNWIFDPYGGVGIGTTSRATPTEVSHEMFAYQFVQAMKDSGSDGFVTWSNVQSMVRSTKGNTGGQTGVSDDQLVLSRNYFAQRLFNGSTGIDWTNTLYRGRMISDAGAVLYSSYDTQRSTVQMKAGESCCPPPQNPCDDCVCRTDTSGLPLCFDIGKPECCTLADRCRYEGVNCASFNCECTNSSCRYSPGAPGINGCPPDFVPVAGCSDSACSLCCSKAASVECLCCCVGGGGSTEEALLMQTRAFDASPISAGSTDFRSLYRIPYGGLYGSSRLSINKYTNFLRHSIVSALDPLVTGQFSEINTTGSLL